MRVGYTSGASPNTRLPEIAKERTKLGSAVFFVNYQPITDSLRRNPNQSLIPPNLDPNVYDKPAIYGGIVTGYQQNGDYIVSDGLRSYGAISQTVSRRGSSGGAAFNDEGALIGISIEIPLDNSPGQQPYTIIQPVTELMVEDLAKELNALLC